MTDLVTLSKGIFQHYSSAILISYMSKVCPKSTNFFSFSKLLVVVLGPVGVEQLVSVEDAPSARFACYGGR